MGVPADSEVSPLSLWDLHREKKRSIIHGGMRALGLLFEGPYVAHRAGRGEMYVAHRAGRGEMADCLFCLFESSSGWININLNSHTSTYQIHVLSLIHI